MKWYQDLAWVEEQQKELGMRLTQRLSVAHLWVDGRMLLSLTPDGAFRCSTDLKMAEEALSLASRLGEKYELRLPEGWVEEPVGEGELPMYRHSETGMRAGGKGSTKRSRAALRAIIDYLDKKEQRGS